MDDAGVTALLDVLAELPPIGSWVTDAACRGQGDTFTNYPQRRDLAELVERTCRGCPVRGACLAYSNEHQVDGVWAGEWHSPSTGAVVSLEPRAPRPAVPCGTTRGYRGHLRRSEPPCTACREANNAKTRERTAAKRYRSVTGRQRPRRQNLGGGAVVAPC